ncbi:MAG TPA: branched-chain amino acid ABC transporter substrate-binding protein [Longimicrobium sp.]|nr:branched-chain amino acid ABC transporter substrate-binding protein [Longimicrobium sp.]
MLRPSPRRRGFPLRPRARLFGAHAALVAAFALASCGRGQGGQVVFALSGPLQQDYGVSTLRGAELAVKEINADRGINGQTLVLLPKDDGADKEKAISIAAELVKNASVVALAGPVNSGTTIAAAPIYNGEADSVSGRLPQLATTATSPDVSKLGDWTYRVAGSDSANAVVLATMARQLAPQVAVMYTNDDYGRGLAASFRAALVKNGGRVAEYDPFSDDTPDFTPYLRRIQMRGVQMVFVAGLDSAAAMIIRQARGLGMQARFIGGDGLVPLVGKGPAFEGTLVGLLYHRDASERARAFADAYRKAYGADPDPFAAAAYDAVKLLAAAARANGPTREGIQRYLHTLGQNGGAPAFQGATGDIRFDAHGDPLQKGFAVGVITNGTIQLNRGGTR